MKKFISIIDPELVRIIKGGAVGVLKTDTLYGIVALAEDKQAVEKVYTAKRRDKNKASIVLIADTLQIWNQPAVQKNKELLEQNWPGPVSIILPAGPESPAHVHRGENSIAYRLPDNVGLQKLLADTGPLIAPSANIEGQPPAETIGQAYGYFGRQIDFYVDSGICQNTQPSKLIKIESDGKLVQLR